MTLNELFFYGIPITKFFTLIVQWQSLAQQALSNPIPQVRQLFSTFTVWPNFFYQQYIYKIKIKLKIQLI